MLSESACACPVHCAPWGAQPVTNNCYIGEGLDIMQMPLAGHTKDPSFAGVAASCSNFATPSGPNNQKDSSGNSLAIALNSPRPNNTAVVARGSIKCSPRL